MRDNLLLRGESMSDYEIYGGAYSGQTVDAAIARALSGGEIDAEIAALKSAVGSPLKASTVAGMTDTNKVYVYTGSETGYTAGHWYYWDGSAWADGGVYNSTAFVTDKTLAVDGAAADAKATGSVTGDLNSAVIADFVTKVTYMNTWGNSGISTSTGENISASNRCRTNSYTQFSTAYKRIKFITPNNMKANWFEYTGTTQSTYNNRCGSLNSQVGGFEISIDPTKYYRFVIANADDSDLTRTDVPLDAIYYTTYATTDTSFAMAGKSADAKGVGDLLTGAVLSPGIPVAITEWTQGTISATTGANQSSTTRCRSSKPISFGDAKAIKISVASGYKVCGIEYYFPSNTTFVQKKFDFAPGQIITSATPTNYYRFVIAKHDDSDITPSDISQTTLIITPCMPEYSLPDYWQTYMSTKIPQLQMMEAEHGRSSAFTFITDIHWESNRKQSPALIKRIQEETSVKRVICGGDLVNYFADKSDAVTIMNAFLGSIDNMATICGNHDDNGESTSVIGTEKLDADARYGVITRKSQAFVDAQSTYFTWIDEGMKIAYIMLDTTDYNLSATQQTWFANQLAALSGDYHIVVVTHIYYSGYDADAGQPIYHDPTGGVIDSIIGASGAGVQNKIICIVTGHTHRDYLSRNAYGIPVIVTKCDSWDKEHDDDMVPGTDREQAFDVYYIDMANQTIYLKRIGSGSDRTVPFRET